MSRTDIVSTCFEVAGAVAVAAGVFVLAGVGFGLVAVGVLSAGFGWLLGGSR